MEYAAKLIDVDTDTITKSMAKLTKNMTSTSEPATTTRRSMRLSVFRNSAGFSGALSAGGRDFNMRMAEGECRATLTAKKRKLLNLTVIY